MCPSVKVIDKAVGKPLWSCYAYLESTQFILGLWSIWSQLSKQTQEYMDNEVATDNE